MPCICKPFQAQFRFVVKVQLYIESASFFCIQCLIICTGVMERRELQRPARQSMLENITNEVQEAETKEQTNCAIGFNDACQFASSYGTIYNFAPGSEATVNVHHHHHHHHHHDHHHHGHGGNPMHDCASDSQKTGGNPGDQKKKRRKRGREHCVPETAVVSEEPDEEEGPLARVPRPDLRLPRPRPREMTCGQSGQSHWECEYAPCEDGSDFEMEDVDEVAPGPVPTSSPNRGDSSVVEPNRAEKITEMMMELANRASQRVDQRALSAPRPSHRP